MNSNLRGIKSSWIDASYYFINSTFFYSKYIEIANLKKSIIYQ